MPTEKDRGIRNFCRAFCRINIIVFREFLRDNIPLRASALSFIVILSMIPVLALGTSLLKGLSKDNELRKSVHLLIVQFEASPENKNIDPLTPNQDRSQPNDFFQPPAEEQFANTLGNHLHKAVDFVFDYVEETNFAALGAIGIFFLLLALYMVLDSIEQTINDIWQAGGGRSPWRKLLDYLALMVIMPLAINLGIAAWAVLHSKKLMAILQYWLPGVGLQLLSLFPVFALIAAFSFFYGFLPHTRVKPTAALAGGIVGGFSWLLIQSIYFKLQIIVVNYNAIYGSFATLPLFLIWINLSWMVFLAGAEVSFATQNWRRYHPDKLILTPIGRLGLAYEIISTIAKNYRQHQITTRENLVMALGQPDAHVDEILNVLTDANYLHYVEDKGGGYVPSAPLAEMNTLKIGELIMGKLPTSLDADNPAIKAFESIRRSLAADKIPQTG
ncbi:MAG: YihY/virulence factor BrkB family protein [Desulfobulbales bacterium]|nr:YihY/virulence factor BrkB family protein [Desulfobulbales bacterium]